MPYSVYTLLLYLMLPLMPLKLLWRGIKQPEYLSHWGERFGSYAVPVSKPTIWIHCVSVGETRAAEPLIRTLLKKYPQHQIVITHTTPTGRDTSAQLFKDEIAKQQILRVYLPYDVPSAVNTFIKHFKPQLGMLMETELWFNLIRACHQQQIPLVLLNARLSAKSANGYAKLGSLVKQGLQQLNLIAAQSIEDETRFKMLGAENTVVTGNIKFDVTAPATSLADGEALRALLGKERTVLIAASTREGEEAMILEAVAGLDLLTVIIPRHPQRFDEVEVLLNTSKIKYLLRTEVNGPVDADTRVILGNTMGELFTYYAAGDFAFVGGSMLKFGGQNLIEPASMGKPILIGKYTYNFAEATKGAVKMGAATQVKDVEDLRNKIKLLMSQPNKRAQMSKAALEFSKASTGATFRVFKAIDALLPPPSEN